MNLILCGEAQAYKTNYMWGGLRRIKLILCGEAYAYKTNSMWGCLGL